ncbi:MAG: hypothetical protein RR052_04055 [Oscillospiraceae bacterium]
MKKKTILFSKDIPPACEYCENGTPGTDEKMILCNKQGIVSPYYKCRSFVYSPIKRIPKRMPKLPGFSDEDFSL